MKRLKNLKISAAILIAALLCCCCKNDRQTDVIVEKPETQVTSGDEQKCDEDFDAFFEKFSEDSLFQKQHVKFPLKNTYLNSDDNYEKLVRYTKAGEYMFSDFKTRKTVLETENGNYKVEIIKERDSAFYQVRGIDNGIFTDVKFAIINGCWYMVAIDDSST